MKRYNMATQSFTAGNRDRKRPAANPNPPRPTGTHAPNPPRPTGTGKPNPARPTGTTTYSRERGRPTANPNAPVGQGGRFAAVEANAAKNGAKNPAAVAAAVGRKKYGASRFAKMAAAGRK